jgi:hypothetical protein
LLFVLFTSAFTFFDRECFQSALGSMFQAGRLGLITDDHGYFSAPDTALFNRLCDREHV